MEESRNSELKPGYKRTKNSTITGKRLVSTTSVRKTEAYPNDTYYVPMPKLSQNKVIVPDTMNLVYGVRSGTKLRLHVIVADSDVVAL